MSGCWCERVRLCLFRGKMEFEKAQFENVERFEFSIAMLNSSEAHYSGTYAKYINMLSQLWKFSSKQRHSNDKRNYICELIFD